MILTEKTFTDHYILSILVSSYLYYILTNTDIMEIKLDPGYSDDRKEELLKIEIDEMLVYVLEDFEAYIDSIEELIRPELIKDRARQLITLHPQVFRFANITFGPWITNLVNVYDAYISKQN